MSKIFVIAGNHAQATDWMKENIKKRMASGETSVSYSDYVLRPNEDSLSGIANPHGVFIGTWRERNDMHEIFMKLINHTQTTSPSHRIILRLYQEWMKTNRPTPKVNSYNAAIQNAAKNLADAIDQDVLNLTMKVVR